MTELRAGRIPANLAWLLAACAAGAAGAILQTSGDFRPVGLAVAAIGIVGLMLWRVEYAVVVVLLTLPLDLAGRIIEEPVTITLFHAALLVALLSWGIRVWLAPRQALRFSAMDVGLLALVAAVVWSLPHSLDPTGTAFSLVRIAFLWLFTLVIANVLTDERRLDTALAVIAGTGVLTSALTFVQWRYPEIAPGNTAVWVTVGTERITRVSAFFDDPNYLAGFLTVVIVVGVGKALHSRSLGAALPWLAAAGACVAALLMTLSRTGWVGVLVGLGVLLLTAPKRRRMWLCVAAAVVAVLFVAAASDTFAQRFSSIGSVEEDRSVSTRYYMIDSTIDIIKERWVWGTGLDAYERAYPEFRRVRSEAGIIRPHQLPLAMWAEMGLAGLLAEVLIAAALIRLYVRRRGRGWTVYEALALAGLLSMLVQTLFQYYLYFEYLWLFLAFSVVATRLAREKESFNA